MRAEAGRPILVRALFTGADGEAPADQPGEVAVTVTDGAGSAVAAGTATRVDIGIYEFTVPAQIRLDQLRVTFIGATATVTVPVTVVARRLATVTQVRGVVAGRESELVGGTATSPAVLAAALDAAEDWLVEALGFPPVLAGWRARWVNDFGGDTLHVPGVRVPGEIYELTRGSDEVDLEDVFASGTGWTHWESGPWLSGRYVGWGTHGLLDPPAQLGRACAVLAGYLSRPSNVPERATMIATEGSQIVLARPSADRPIGLPEVDGIVGSMARRSPLGGW